MRRNSENLRTVLERFEIKNKTVAAALNLHPSMITRWMNHERLLGVNSKYLEPLADYIFSRKLTAEDMEWFKKRFHEYGIKGDFLSVAEMKRALRIWLVTDPNDDISGLLNSPLAGANQNRIYSGDYMAIAGITDITLRLSSLLAKLEQGALVYMRLSGESVAVCDSFVHLIKNSMDTFGIRFRVLLSLSNKNIQPSKTLITYITQIVNQDIEVSVAYEDTVPFAEETMVIIPGRCVMTITILADSSAPPAALLIKEKTYVHDAGRNFIETIARSQPLFDLPAQSTSRRFQSMSQESYEKGGGLSIIRDGLSPLYMSAGGFEHFLVAQGYEGEVFEWRLNEFCERKEAMDGNLKYGMPLRELIPLPLLDAVAEKGSCVMFGEDLLETGAVRINTSICLEMLEGYMHYLTVFPNFSIRVTNTFPLAFRHAHCLIKEDRHVLIKRRRDDTESCLISQQPVLLQGISGFFDDIWEGLNYMNRGGEATLYMLKRYYGEIGRHS